VAAEYSGGRWLEDHALAIGEVGVIRAGQRELRLLITGYAENRLLEMELIAVDHLGTAGAALRDCPRLAINAQTLGRN
jgi:hypothetical protein